MNGSGIDLDDADALTRADRAGLLYAAASSGAQVRAAAAAVTDALPTDPDAAGTRALVLIAPRGTGARAAAVFAADAAAHLTVPLVTAPRTPSWVGALDTVLVLGDDAGDPATARAIDDAAGRGATVVVTVAEEGPVGAAGAGRAIWCPPRLPGADRGSMFHHLAAAIAVGAALCPRYRARLAPVGGLPGAAEAVDAEALRNAPAREAFRNPAKTLAERLDGPVLLAGDDPVAAAVTAQAAAAVLTGAGLALPTATVAEVLAAPRPRPVAESIFHDPLIDGSAATAPTVLVHAAAADAHRLRAATAALPRREIIVAGDEPEPTSGAPAAAELDDVPALVQWLVLLARWEYAAAYAAVRGAHEGDG